MRHGLGDPILSPMSMRRPSLAPSMAEGVENPNGGLVELELEPGKGKARGKDDGSSLLSSYKKWQCRRPCHRSAPSLKRPLTTTEVVDAVIPIDIRLEGNVSRGHRPRNPFDKRAPRDTPMRQTEDRGTHFLQAGEYKKAKTF